MALGEYGWGWDTAPGGKLPQIDSSVLASIYALLPAMAIIAVVAFFAFREYASRNKYRSGLRALLGRVAQNLGLGELSFESRSRTEALGASAGPLSIRIAYRLSREPATILKVEGIEALTLRATEGDGTRLDGPASLVAALAGEPMKARLQTFLDGGGEIEDGQIRRTLTGIEADVAVLTDAASEMLSLGVSLRILRENLPTRLCEVATQDPGENIRLRALRFLIAEWPRSEQTQQAARFLSRGGSAAVRIDAAEALAKEGEPVLRELLADRADESIRVRALQDLAISLEPARAAEVVESVLADPSTRVRNEAIRRALHRRLPVRLDSSTVIDHLAKLSADDTDGPALDWLAKNAGPEAVEALARLAASLRSLIRPNSPRPGHIEGTIAAIRERARSQGADAGQIAIAQDDRGSLSVSAAAGALSVTRK